MKSSTKTLIEAMQILANDTHSDDGVANAAISEAGERLKEQVEHIEALQSNLKNAEESLTIAYMQGFEDGKNKSIDTLKKPCLFWDAENTETSHDCVESLMDYRFSNGAQIGETVDVQRAVLLPNKSYFFTTITDDDFDYQEEVK